jgi:signal transduction histidine kinase
MSGYAQTTALVEFTAARPLRLLIVEDMTADAELMVITLETADIAFACDTADSLSECQHLLQTQQYDAVLSDFRLKGFTAYEVLRLLQQSQHEIPFILVTGSLGEEAAVECIKAGMTDYVLKDRLFRLPSVLARSLQEFELRRQQQAAIAQIQRQADREKVLNQISRAINSSLDPNYILQEIVRMTGECLGGDQVLLLTIGEAIQAQHEWRANEQITSLLHLSMPATEWAEVLAPESDFYQKRVLHIPDFCQFPLQSETQKQLEQAQIGSLISVPIFIHDERFGALSLSTVAQRTFTGDEIYLLQRIADQTAIALYNAQSYEHLEKLVQKRTQELEHEKRLSDAANRAKSEFLANMSHELRTPLTGILGFSSVLLQRAFGDLTPKQEQYLSGIHSCGEHLLELINDLLDLSKIEAGREELVLEPIAIQEVCESGISLVREMANDRGLQVSWSIAPDIEIVVADRRRLRQILFNLLSNAVKFTEVGSVKLAVTQTQDMIEFAVIDTGIGISSTDQLRLFQPFQQLDSGFDKKYQGTGLGLALARKLALLHGGDIVVTSQPNQGSCFTLKLPLHPSEFSLWQEPQQEHLSA